MKSIFACALIIILFTCCKNEQKTQVQDGYESGEVSEDTSKEHGKYLVTVMDCNTCHTPNIMTDQGPKPDMSKLLSGYPSDRPNPKFNNEIVMKGVLFPHPDLTAAMGPWGISFAGNLTSDDTGIGTWSLGQFTLAMQKGKYKGLEGSRTLLPPMPWQSYATLSEADIEAIYNYLKSIEPIENIVPAPIPPE
ncbi:c-type cytochrome [Winogradskyella ouciana]|uniref:Diheme cytochrome c-553 n=1 Tax=Winogradskyella ouciana TaxID=2608631 RepID=A0A7K1G9G7_9FLAO|nr:c-type cytochrome [Winogradskyella ouciana]MTE25926.1 diheme cytochrome c-553 [Winogradskyella ouciana]